MSEGLRLVNYLAPKVVGESPDIDLALAFIVVGRLVLLLDEDSQAWAAMKDYIEDTREVSDERA